MKILRARLFDLDRTLVQGNSSVAFCLYLVSKRVVPLFTLFYAMCYYVRHRFFGMGLKELHTAVFQRVLKGRSMALLEKYVDPFVCRYLSKCANAPVVAQLRLAQHLGEFTMILSNAPHFLVGRFAHFLGVDDWRATQYAVDMQQRLSEIKSVLQGRDKAHCVRELIRKFRMSKQNIVAYSDSYLDLPFLLAAGTPVVVNPDRKLHSLSRLRDWTVL